MKFTSSSLSARALLVVFTSASALACSDSTDPVVSDDIQFGSVITTEQLRTELNSPTRVEIKLVPGGLVAREVQADDDSEEDEIQSNITAIDAAGGTVTLELSGLVVSYTSSTQFRTTTNSNASRTTWEQSVSSSLAGGTRPAIRARRNPLSTPQAPTSAAFAANELRLESSIDEPRIVTTIDADNFETVTSPPPLAILRIFNLPIQITTSTSIHRLSGDGTIPSGSIEFEGRVTAVNVTAGTLTLSGGTIIRATGITLSVEGDLLTLANVASAVSAGQVVRAEGRGTVESAGPPATIVATQLKVEVDD